MSGAGLVLRAFRESLHPRLAATRDRHVMHHPHTGTHTWLLQWSAGALYQSRSTVSPPHHCPMVSSPGQANPVALNRSHDPG